jgi:hypothetical protein
VLGFIELAKAAPSVEQCGVVAEREREPGLELLDELLGGCDVPGLGEGLEKGEEKDGVIMIWSGREEREGKGQDARGREAAEDGGE